VIAVRAIVVVHDPDATLLDRCLRALDAQSEPVAITLVDNGSSAAVIHRLAERTLRRANDGFAAALNAAIDDSDEPLILICNDDAAPSPDMVRLLVERLDAEPDDVAAASPKVWLDVSGDERIIDSAGLALQRDGEAFSRGVGQLDRGQFDDDRWCLGPCLSVAMVRRVALRQFGAFDPNYFLYYEDLDWAVRIARSGARCAFVPTATAVHRHAATTRRSPAADRFAMVQRNLLRCALVNLPARNAGYVWVRHLRIALTATIRRAEFWRRRWVALAGAARNAPRALQTRRVRRSLWVSPRCDDVFAWAQGQSPQIDATSYEPQPD
jgi:N-acetylglucosaminyl-diphospho-decaprenol L-rhamnosyltransferase